MFPNDFMLRFTDERIDKLEQKYDYQFKIVFTALQQMLKEENEPRPKVGFKRTGE
jgi:hypothetical protein